MRIQRWKPAIQGENLYMSADKNGYMVDYKDYQKTEVENQKLRKVAEAARELIIEVCNECCHSDSPGECKCCEYGDLMKAVEKLDGKDINVLTKNEGADECLK